MTQEILKLALEYIEAVPDDRYNAEHIDRAALITAIEEALAQPEQEPVAYDKTEMNCFVQDLYDKKMKEGKHGHYETMFHVVHQAIKRVPPQRTWVGLTDEDRYEFAAAQYGWEELLIAAEAKLKEKNNA